MSRFSDQVRDEYGRTVPGVKVYVFKWDADANAAGDLETLLDDSSAPLANPVITDDDGLYYFNSLDGQKLLELHYGGKDQLREMILVGALPVPQATFGGLFSNASALTIPVGMDLICTTGYSSLDVGAAVYTADAAVNSAYVTAHPRSSFVSLNGRGFRLSLEQDISPEMLGATGLGVADDYPAFQASIDLLPAAGGSIGALAGTYKLLTEPTAGSKDIVWNISPAAVFTGAGTGAGKFPPNGGSLEHAVKLPSVNSAAYVDGLKVGDPSLFAYPHNNLAQVYRDAGLTTTDQHTFRVVTAAKGDSATYRPQYNAYFEYRDRSDVTSLTKNAGYALSCSVSLLQARNNVPIDDVAGLTIGNTGGVVTAKATDAFYISENPLYTAAGNSEWYSIWTADCKADVGIQIKYAPSTGKIARFPNASYIYHRNAANNADLKVIGLDGSNYVQIGDTAAAGLDINGPVRALSRPVSSVVSAATYTVAAADANLTFSAACVVTLPSAASFPGREIRLRQTFAGTVTSATSNVVPLAGGSAGTAILSGAAKFALLSSDGAVWQTLVAN